MVCIADVDSFGLIIHNIFLFLQVLFEVEAVMRFKDRKGLCCMYKVDVRSDLDSA